MCISSEADKVESGREKHINIKHTTEARETETEDRDRNNTNRAGRARSCERGWRVRSMGASENRVPCWVLIKRESYYWGVFIRGPPLNPKA